MYMHKLPRWRWWLLAAAGGWWCVVLVLFCFGFGWLVAWWLAASC
jgi:hypothetical protein